MKTKKLQKKNISMSTNSSLVKKEWFLEYSVPQKCFHISTYDKILMTNRDTCRRSVCPGYVIIDGPMVYNELGHSMEKWAKTLNLKLKDFW
jgi:hypothetical protein